VAEDRSGTNPDLVPGAAPPVAATYQVNGTTLYAEVRGSGPAVLLIPGGAEDGEAWRGIAERLGDRTVVTYDRRGTRRSGRDAWPGAGSAQHADDAAGLLRVLGLRDVTVVGGSSGGVIALRLALRHPASVRRSLVYEPGFFRVHPDGEATQRPVDVAIQGHLERHPADWLGAYRAFIGAVAPSPTSELQDIIAAPPGKEWYAEREEGNAEPFVRDDIPILTREVPDEAALAASEVEVRFSYGTASLAIFREIAERLAAVRGETPDAIEGVGHVLYFHPELAVAYIRRRSRA
jgi:pimeloyl-ACP methyl ester carboxylesterase